MSSWVSLQNHPSPGYCCLRLAHRASSMHRFLLHLLWGELGLLWSCCLFHWLCCSWGIIWSLSTSLQISIGHHWTTLGPVLCSSAILPRYSRWLLQLLVLVLLTSLCPLVCTCLSRLLHWFARILVILIMPLSCLFFLNSFWLFVVYTTHVSFPNR